MKKSTIQFEVELDNQNIPTRILWDATDKPEPGMTETKSISVSLWDQKTKNTLRIDLWSKDMPVEEMKRFSHRLHRRTGSKYPEFNRG